MIDHGPYRHLQVEVDDGVATVTIDRPDVLNAMNVATVLDLERAFAELNLRSDVELVLVTGAGDRAFSSGADTSEYSSDDRHFHETRARHTYEMATSARTIRPPTIAQIDGYCLGGGLILAMYCDLRIAAETAEFGVPTTQIGQIPGGGATYRLVELVGEAAAKELVLSGERIGAECARSIGLVNRVAMQESIDDAVADLVASLRDGGANALAKAKESINAAADEIDRSTSFANETERWWAQYDSDERRRLSAERDEK
ncbi:enoyl-CoA hydratase/isomerase family protein [Natrinema gelatinilyticum]|uniref:enoyl-CoA hydratase/isomerase family protein n=1 Tax=Natrinema gelatinilyticum TaxID=2961571 RepID=UPI0020C46D8E|nr:enoyl-CoA hydratase/isomerase family protein [Natrinema gelatinilyticum]